MIVFGAMEAALTPLMEAIEREHTGVKVFSLPSVDHPQYGRHIELGVKGAPEAVAAAYPALLAGLAPFATPTWPRIGAIMIDLFWCIHDCTKSVHCDANRFEDAGVLQTGKSPGL